MSDDGIRRVAEVLVYASKKETRHRMLRECLGLPNDLDLGNTPVMERLIIRGYLSEYPEVEGPALRWFKRQFKRGPGQPPKHPFEGKDAQRALACWYHGHILASYEAGELGHDIKQDRITKLLRASNRRGLRATNRQLIELAKTALQWPETTSQRALESSVSRGKSILEMDQFWRSKVCEELLLNSS
ncbi:hypothetical protein [Tropicimonas aquimaris]|uniref:Regulatory protein RecX n=1 Tax=Tropicimonas aquimaris TaxID=914152 RepID=A0ABW3IMI8_9RHOB